MLPSFARETLQVIRATSVTDRGTSRMDWSNPTIRNVTGCSFQPAVGTDDIRYRQAVGGPAQAFMPPGTDVIPADRIGRKGKVYEIEGEVQEWASPSGRLDSLLLNLRIWEG